MGFRRIELLKERKLSTHTDKLYKYTAAYLQEDQWCIKVPDKKFVKLTDEQGLHWIKVVLHSLFCLLLCRTDAVRDTQTQCNPISKLNSILSITYGVKWIVPHTQKETRPCIQCYSENGNRLHVQLFNKLLCSRLILLLDTVQWGKPKCKDLKDDKGD